ncbi:MAG TPA: hypothetical protein V6C76_15215 [Drouetiella sp.]
MKKQRLAMVITFLVAVILIAAGQVVCADAARLYELTKTDADVGSTQNSNTNPWDSMHHSYASKHHQKHADRTHEGEKWTKLKHSFDSTK